MRITNKTTHRLLMCFFTLAMLLSPSIPATGQTNLPCTPPPANLVAWYPGDGNALDIQGANNGTLQNGATFTTTANGRVQEAFSFDGSDDFIEAPDTPANSVTGEITIDAWVRPTANRIQTILSKYNTNAGQVSYWLGLLPNGGARFIVSAANPSIYRYVDTNAATVPLNAYTHLAGTFNPATQEMKIYINGVDSPTTLGNDSSNVPSIGDNGIPVRIGGVHGSSSGILPFIGTIDEAEIFNRVLAPHEIRAIYNSGANGKCKPCAAQPANLVAWYQGDGGAADAVGINHGTLQNGITFSDGRVKEAFNFDGVNDSVTVPDSPALDMLSAGTIEAWINLNNTNNGAFINKGNAANNQASYTWEVYNGDLRFDLYKGDGSTTPGYVALTTPASNFVGGWNHVAVSWDGDTLRLYRNGSEISSTAYSFVRQDTPYIVGIGTNNVGYNPINGRADEIGFYSRALDATEIFNMYKAGSAGKCPSCAAAPTGQVAFYTADGTSEDSIGTNEGTMQNGAFYGVGKVDKAFSFDGVDDFIEIPDAPALQNQNFTLEGWINFSSTTGNNFMVIAAKSFGASDAQNSWALHFDSVAQALRTYTSTGGGPFPQVIAPFAPQSGVWYHVAQTYDGTTHRIYINGVLGGTYNQTITVPYDSNPVTIGAERVNGQTLYPFSGRIDELGIYNTAVPAAQIQSIYNAGRGGKCKPALTTNELSVVVTNSSARQNQNFTFTATVTNHGLQPATGVVLNATLPANLSFVSADAGCAFDSASRRITCNIGTIAANFTRYETEKQAEQSSEFSPAAFTSKQIVVQPTMQGIQTTTFTATGNEADAVINNNLFTSTINVLAPTAASVFVGGRVMTADGRGIRNALVTITESDGSTRTVLSDHSGYYRFAEVESSQPIILRISAKRFQFVPNAQIVNVTEDIDNVNFTAQP